jgi:3-deoxy-D-manno-octulosonic-acid transferase
METELWPNLIAACREAGVPLWLVNARLSERSARRYATFSALTREALQGPDGHRRADGRRCRATGNPGGFARDRDR